MAQERCRCRILLEECDFSNALQIIYLSILGPIMLAALLEWFLWLAAFCYCLVKAYKKSQHWSEKVLAVIMIISFVALR